MAAAASRSIFLIFSSLRPDDLGPKELPVLKEEDEETDEEMVPVVIEPSEEKWDCETIISESHFYHNSRDQDFSQYGEDKR